MAPPQGVGITSRMRNALSVGADITQIALAIPLAIALLAGVAGLIAGVAVPALLISLGLLAVVAGYWWWRARALAAALDAERAAQRPKKRKPPEPSRWLPNPRDLSSFGITEADLETALARARTAAADRIGPAPTLAFSGLFLLPDPFVSFDVVSQAAASSGSVLVSERTIDVHDVRRGRTEASPYEGEAPWRSDAAWERLVREAWYRVKPFIGSAVLLPPSSRQGWHVEFDREHEGVIVSEEAYELVDGNVQRVTS